MVRPHVLLGLCAASSALLAPAVAPRRAAPLHVIETEPSTDEKEIFSETTSISGALAELWQVLANPPPPGDFRAMYFPQCEGLKRPQTFQALFEHLEVCKDSSQNFGAHLCGNQPVVGCAENSSLSHFSAILARSSGGGPASPRRRTGIAPMAWRTTRRFSTNAP